jgi:branched-chain amino acid transport system ATP-binding protein
MNVIELSQVQIAYGAAIAVDGADLSVEEGTVVALLGPNGAGKSSIAKAIGGLVKTRSGSITFRGKRLPSRPADIVRAGIAIVPEGRRIFPQLSVEENLLVGGYTSGRDRMKVLRKLQDSFPILTERRTQLGGLLSGGEQQLLAICRALMTQPSLIVLDEPSLGLSPIKIKEVADVIAGMQADGLSVLLIEQNSQFALRIADYAYVLERGVVVDQNSAEVLKNSDFVRKAYLGI